MNVALSGGLGVASQPVHVELWDLDAVALRDRMELWREVVSETHLPWQVRLSKDRPPGFEARVERRRLGDICLIDCWTDPCRGERLPSELTATPGEFVGVLMLLGGAEWVEQSERDVSLAEGDLIAWDSVRPARFVVSRPVHKRTLLVPRPRFQQLVPRPEQTTVRRLPPTPACRLFTSYLDFLTHVDLEPTAAVGAGNAALELLGAVLGSVVAPTRSAYREALRAQARSYIAERLSDLDLTPASVASALAVSVRSLYGLFEEEGDSVCAFIRRLRLARAHDDLTRPDASPTVTEIAFRWGFADASHFTRSFSAHYGYPPREARRATRTEGETTARVRDERQASQARSSRASGIESDRRIPRKTLASSHACSSTDPSRT